MQDENTFVHRKMEVSTQPLRGVADTLRTNAVTGFGRQGKSVCKNRNIVCGILYGLIGLAKLFSVLKTILHIIT